MEKWLRDYWHRIVLGLAMITWMLNTLFAGAPKGFWYWVIPILYALGHASKDILMALVQIRAGRINDSRDDTKGDTNGSNP